MRGPWNRALRCCRFDLTMRHAIVLFSAYLLLGTAVCYSAAAPDPAFEITIHLYDYSGMEPSASRDAQSAVAAILLQAGITVRWEDCAVTIPTPAGAPPCTAGKRGVKPFFFSVLPERMAVENLSPPQKIRTSMMRPGGRLFNPG